MEEGKKMYSEESRKLPGTGGAKVRSGMEHEVRGRERRERRETNGATEWSE
jgi:hypothetical protein